MKIDALGPRLRAVMKERAAEYGLQADAVQVTYRPHDGGFVNAGFTVSDGATHLHAKCVEQPHRLEPWRRFGDRLVERYRAPHIVGFFDLDEWSVMVNEHIPGVVPADGTMPRVCAELLPVLDALHADEDLEAALDHERPPSSAMGYSLDVCEADLRELDELPPFVSADDEAWMRAEVPRLRALVESSSAFDDAPVGAVHGDLWQGNLLNDGSRIWIIDWDTLRRGDPALDLVLLLFSAIEEGLDARGLLGPRDDAFWERFELGLRGTNLIGVVDSLADWVEARHAPSVMERSRARSEASHRWAIERYRERYD